jgi:uncharacterized protein (DUF4415 family)
MARKPNPGLIDEDAPELTDAELAEMRPAREVLPPEFFAMVTTRKPGQRGPGKKPAKVLLTLRVEPETLTALRARGPGWQRLASEVLRKAAKARSAAPARGRAAGKVTRGS